MSGWLGRMAGSSFTHVAMAFCAMGGWAVFANRMHPMPEPVVAGVVQGTVSGCITWFLKTAIEAMAKQLEGLAALLLPPIVSFAASVSLLSIIHLAAGTPEVIATISVPLTVATSYAAIYSFALWRKRGDSRGRER